MKINKFKLKGLEKTTYAGIVATDPEKMQQLTDAGYAIKPMGELGWDTVIFPDGINVGVSLGGSHQYVWVQLEYAWKHYCLLKAGFTIIEHPYYRTFVYPNGKRDTDTNPEYRGGKGWTDYQIGRAYKWLSEKGGVHDRTVES